MTDKDKDLRICPFRLAAVRPIPPHLKGLSQKEMMTMMQNQLCCFKELCQWWWLCSGEKIDWLIEEIDSFLKLVDKKIGD